MISGTNIFNYFRNKNRPARGQGGAAGSVGERTRPPQAGAGAEARQQDQGRQVPGVLRPHTEGAQAGLV
jgi:hypothetical protein